MRKNVMSCAPADEERQPAAPNAPAMAALRVIILPSPLLN
jgi:hypothetical protein